MEPAMTGGVACLSIMPSPHTLILHVLFLQAGKSASLFVPISHPSSSSVSCLPSAPRGSTTPLPQEAAEDDDREEEMALRMTLVDDREEEERVEEMEGEDAVEEGVEL